VEIFGIGFFEIVAVLLLAGIIFGPHRLPELAGQMGRAVRELREYARDFRDEYLVDFEEAKEEYLEIRHELQAEGQEFQSEMQEADAEIRSSLKEIEDETQEVVAEVKHDETPASARARSQAAATKQAPSGPKQSLAAGEKNAQSRSRRGRRRTQQTPVARPSNVISLQRRREGDS